MIELYPHQAEAIGKMHNGCILCGGTGSGKSITAIGYYYLQNGGEFRKGFRARKMSGTMPLYIITTAKKRDSHEWEGDLLPFHLGLPKEYSERPVVIDSWNNIAKYKDIRGAFFIFDEQRVVGKGQWVKSFIQIARANQWILLSATPGDTWTDYIPVFIANGYYRNRTEFMNEHVVMNYRGAFPVLERYLGVMRLERLRSRVLVDMDYRRDTVSHDIVAKVDYDILSYKKTMKTRVDPWTGEPFQGPSALCTALRKIVNSDPSRGEAVVQAVQERGKVIIFYSFDYELDILRQLPYGAEFEVAEWNGHKHQDVPTGEKWVYLVQYNAGAEGWNCIRTDTILFYSQQYSYKIWMQARGRIDRMNTPYQDLYYITLKSTAPIDIMIARALSKKKNFNEGRHFVGLFERSA